MSHHQANLEPLNFSEFLLTVLSVSKVADPCVSSGWSATFETKRTVSKNSKTFRGSKLAC
jgi:hypothetical protein